MNEQEFRILDILSREIGNPVPIYKLAEKIRQIYGSGDYKNIHVAIQEMLKKKILKLEKTGRSAIASLNFENYLLIDLLAEMELIRKHKFLERRQEFQMLMLEINSYITNFYLVKSIALINPERNAKLNRVELLFLLRQSKTNHEVEAEIKAIRTIMELLQSIHNIKIDYLFLNDVKFIDLLKSEEANTAKEILADKVVLFYPQNFWMEIKTALEKGIRIKIEEQETNPAKISEQNVAYNLARFGYKEMGTKIIQGKPIGIEYIITSILLKKDSIRRIEAIPVILAKNDEKTNYSLLVFLATKYGILRELYGILKALNAVKQMNGITNAVKALADMKIKEIKASIKNIEQKLRLYDVIR